MFGLGAERVLPFQGSSQSIDVSEIILRRKVRGIYPFRAFCGLI